MVVDQEQIFNCKYDEPKRAIIKCVRYDMEDEPKLVENYECIKSEKSEDIEKLADVSIFLYNILFTGSNY